MKIEVGDLIRRGNTTYEVVKVEKDCVQASVFGGWKINLFNKDDLKPEEIYREYKENDSEEIKDYYIELLNECKNLRQAKNSDYGDSFESTIDLFGFCTGFGIIRNKLWRAINVMLKQDQTVKDDALSDEIRDVANYLLLLGAHVRRKEENGEEINFYGIK